MIFKKYPRYLSMISYIQNNERELSRGAAAPFISGFLIEAVFVIRGVEGIEVLAVELIGQQPEILAETLIMNNFPRSQKADRILYIRIITEAQDVVIGGSGFLLP